MFRRNLASLLLVLLALPSALLANNKKISSDLQDPTFKSNSASKEQVLIQYNSSSKINCGGLLDLVGCLVNDVTNLGGTILQELPLVNGVVASLDHKSVVALADQANVVYSSKN